MSGNKASKQKPCHHCKNRPASAPPGTSTIHYEKFWLYRHCSSVQQRDRHAQKAGQLFSGLLAMNVVFLGSAFISSMIFNHVAITLADLWILLSILKVLCLCWIIYYLLGTSRQPHAVLYRDSHAGPVWIRGEFCFYLSSHAFPFFSVLDREDIGILPPLLKELEATGDVVSLWCKAGRRQGHSGCHREEPKRPGKS